MREIALVASIFFYLVKAILWVVLLVFMYPVIESQWGTTGAISYILVSVAFTFSAVVSAVLTGVAAE